MYIYYIVHLNIKGTTDYTGVESYVSVRYNRSETNWIPRQRAIVLTQNEDEGEFDEMAKMHNRMTSVMARADALNERIVKLAAIAVKKSKA